MPPVIPFLFLPAHSDLILLPRILPDPHAADAEDAPQRDRSYHFSFDEPFGNPPLGLSLFEEAPGVRKRNLW